MMCLNLGVCSDNATDDTHKFDTIVADSIKTVAATACLDYRQCEYVAAQLSKEFGVTDRKEYLPPQHTKEGVEPELKHQHESGNKLEQRDEENQRAQRNPIHSRILAAQRAAQRAKDTTKFEEQFSAWEAGRAQEEAKQRCAPKSNEAEWNISFSVNWQKVLEKHVATLQQGAASPELLSIVDCRGRDLGFMWDDDNKLELFDVPEHDIFPLVIRLQGRTVDEEGARELENDVADAGGELKRDEQKMQPDQGNAVKEQTQRENHENKESKTQEAREAEALKKEKIETFLKARGFQKINSKRMGKLSRFKYPLHTAVKREPEMIPMLLEAGADPSRKNSAGLTPLQYAKKIKAYEAEGLLSDRPAFHRGAKHS